jgi:hypothetical protein
MAKALNIKKLIFHVSFNPLNDHVVNTVKERNAAVGRFAPCKLQLIKSGREKL